MRRPFQLIGTFFLSLSLAGCTVRMIDFTILSTKNIDLARASTFKRGAARVEGKDEISIIIFIPTGVPNVKEAIDRAIESVPGAVALLDGVVMSHYFYIPYIYGKQAYVVEGTPLIDPQLAAGQLRSNFIFAKLNKDGNVQELRYVNQKEYEKLRKRLVAKGERINL
jgi:hypothetical protein